MHVSSNSFNFTLVGKCSHLSASVAPLALYFAQGEVVVLLLCRSSKLRQNHLRTLCEGSGWWLAVPESPVLSDCTACLSWTKLCSCTRCLAGTVHRRLSPIGAGHAERCHETDRCGRRTLTKEAQKHLRVRLLPRRTANGQAGGRRECRLHVQDLLTLSTPRSLNFRDGTGTL